MTENLTEDKHNSLFDKDQTQGMRNILKALNVCINGDFRLLVILPFMITGDFKRGLLLSLMNYYGGSYKGL